MTRDAEIATTILAQLGGNRFLVMTGTTFYMAIQNGLRLNLRRNMSKANRLEITLDALDTYTVRFYHYKAPRLNKKTFEWTDEKITEVAEHTGVYCDQLQQIFTTVTGMDTTL